MGPALNLWSVWVRFLIKYLHEFQCGIKSVKFHPSSRKANPYLCHLHSLQHATSCTSICASTATHCSGSGRVSDTFPSTTTTTTNYHGRRQGLQCSWGMAACWFHSKVLQQLHFALASRKESILHVRRFSACRSCERLQTHSKSGCASGNFSHACIAPELCLITNNTKKSVLV